MQTFMIIFLILVIIVSVAFGIWQRKKHSAPAKKEMYKELERRAQAGEKEAMYQLAELFYQEDNKAYYPIIFKWTSILAAQKKDPAVWLLMGDLYHLGCGTERDARRALSCYEQALSADITSGKDTDLTKEAHNYLEMRIMALRREVFK